MKDFDSWFLTNREEHLDEISKIIERLEKDAANYEDEYGIEE